MTGAGGEVDVEPRLRPPRSEDGVYSVPKGPAQAEDGEKLKMKMKMKLRQLEKERMRRAERESAGTTATAHVPAYAGEEYQTVEVQGEGPRMAYRQSMREREPRDRREEMRPRFVATERQPRLDLRGGGAATLRALAYESEIPSYFFTFDRGRPILITKPKHVDLGWSNKRLLGHLQKQYSTLHYGWLLKPYSWVLDVGMIYVLVWRYDQATSRLRLLNKAELVEAPIKGTFTAHDFRYILDNPPPGRSLARTVSKLVQGVRKIGEPPVILMFEFVDLPRARALVTLALLTIPISVVVGIVYGVLQQDIANAISLASYIATACSLFFAILAGGSLLGIEEPHAYTPNDELLEEYLGNPNINRGWGVGNRIG
ncbi:hypothetical protein B0T25DRAFT_238234 [Lasiosphaeria hispida]|uniref:Uncharacterized protein n=1 Tax=Lasiosphaeria hispida TaxID=260671 RepID=A0AAJ0HEX8_9PEZI|nr:hypothetical protein B0T25DRAFT_238234 [Lasiosphaeria hispida]